MSGITVDGADVVLRDIMEMRGFEKKIGPALYGEGLSILGAATQLVPVKFGTLKASGHVEGPDIHTSGGVEVRIVYGGPAADYALIVHENPGARHMPPTVYKFLERPVLAVEPTFDQRIAARLLGLPPSFPGVM